MTGFVPLHQTIAKCVLHLIEWYCDRLGERVRVRGRVMRDFAPHPNPLPMNLAIRSLIDAKSIVAKFMGRGDFLH